MKQRKKIVVLLAVGLFFWVTVGFTHAAPRIRAPGNILSLAASPDGRWIAVGFETKKGGGIQVAPLGKNRARAPRIPKTKSPVGFVGFLNNGTMLAATTYDQQVIVWNVSDGKEIFRRDLKKVMLRGTRLDVLTHPTAPLIAWIFASDHINTKAATLSLVKVPSGETVGSLKNIRSQYQRAFTGDGEHLLLHGAMWNWKSGKAYRVKGMGLAALSADNRVAAFGDTDGQVTLHQFPLLTKLDTIDLKKYSGDFCPEKMAFYRGGKSLLMKCIEDDRSPAHFLIWNLKTKRLRKLKVRGAYWTIIPKTRTLAISRRNRVIFKRLP